VIRQVARRKSTDARKIARCRRIYQNELAPVELNRQKKAQEKQQTGRPVAANGAMAGGRRSRGGASGNDGSRHQSCDGRKRRRKDGAGNGSSPLRPTRWA